MNKLKNIRESKGISQEELAKLAGVRIATISRTENGHTEPHLVTLKALAGALGVSVSDIMEEVE